MKYLIAFLILFITHTTSYAQLNFKILTPLDKNVTFKSILNFCITENGSTASQTYKLTGDLLDNNNEKIYSFQGTISIATGIDCYDENDITNQSTTYIAPSFSSFLINQKALPPGEYAFNLKLFIGSELIASESESIGQSYTPPRLMAPRNKEKLSSGNPTFMWEPAVFSSNVQDYTYSIFIYEKFKTQSVEDAVTYNIPWYTEHFIKTTSLLYNSISRVLKDSHEYVWLIKAYYSDEWLGESEPWTFEMKKKNSQIPNNIDDYCYVIPKKQLDASCYDVYKKIYFDLDNHTCLNDLIFSFSDEKFNSISNRNLKISKESSSNYFISLNKSKAFKNNTIYYMNLSNCNGDRFVVRFKYFDNKNNYLGANEL